MTRDQIIETIRGAIIANLGSASLATAVYDALARDGVITADRESGYYWVTATNENGQPMVAFWNSHTEVWEYGGRCYAPSSFTARGDRLEPPA